MKHASTLLLVLAMAALPVSGYALNTETPIQIVSFADGAVGLFENTQIATDEALAPTPVNFKKKHFKKSFVYKNKPYYNVKPKTKVKKGKGVSKKFYKY